MVFSSWLSELWILAGGGENVKYFAPVIPGVAHHHEKVNLLFLLFNSLHQSWLAPMEGFGLVNRLKPPTSPP